MARLELQNFRSFRNLTLDLSEPVTVLTGRNETGKSSVIDAMHYLLTGVCRGTDMRGAGSDSLVRQGQNGKGASILFRDAQFTLTRNIGDGPGSAAGKVIDSTVKVRHEYIHACMAWDRLINLPAGEAKKLLLSMLGAEVTDESMKAALGALYSYVEGIRFVGPESIEAAYQFAYNERARLKKLVAEPVPDLSAFPPALQKMPLAAAEDLEVQGMKREGALAEQVREAGQSVGSEVATLAVALRGVEEKLSKLRECSPGDVEKARKALGTAAKVVEQLSAEQTTQKVLVEVHEKHLGALEQAKDDEACPMCRGKVTPGTFTKLAKAITKEADAARKKQEAIALKLIKANEEQTVLRAACKAAEDWLGDVRAVQREQTALKRRMDELKAKAALPGGGPAVESQAEIQEALDVTRKKLATLRAYIEARRKIDGIVEAGAVNQKMLTDMVRLVDALGPKSDLRAGLLGEKLTDFTKALLGVLEPQGYDVSIELDPFDILLARRERTDGWISMRMLARSARLRLGAAMQIAIARASGLRIVCIDDIDCLDIEARSKFMQVIDAAAHGEDGGKSVRFIMGAVIKGPVEEFKAPPIPGWKFILMDEVA